MMEHKCSCLPRLDRYIQSLEREIVTIGSERRTVLKTIANYIREKRGNGEKARLTFICTHNSRRSHIAQLWTSALSCHLGLGGAINSFSGGTEVTAFNPRAVEAMRRAGFDIDDPGGDNPVYRVLNAAEEAPQQCFSKRYDHPENPAEGFAAIMVCSDADENCPFIPGAELRIALPYLDPKTADGTPAEQRAYDIRCRQIAAEIYWMLMHVK